MSETLRILVSAGEHSGDQRAAGLLRAFCSTHEGVELKGLGGNALSSVGLRSEFDINALSVVGFAEVIRHLPFFRTVMGRMEKLLDEWQPHRVLLVDYPGFNLRFAKRVRKRGIPITYYISPQIWAWGSGRMKLIQKSIDQMLVLFPFEEEMYRRAGVQAEFVGHPLIDEVHPHVSDTEFWSSLDLPSDTRILALLPGSRSQELSRHLPVMHAACSTLGDCVPVVGLAPGLSSTMAERYSLRWTRNVYDLLARSRGAVVASGTATLETAISGTPLIVVYKTNPISAALARRLIRIPYVAMVNVVAQERIVPELLQSDFNARNVSNHVRELISDEEYRTRMKEGLNRVVRLLGSPGASERAAAALSERIKQQPVYR